MSQYAFWDCLKQNNSKKNEDLLYFINSTDILFERIKDTDPSNNSIIFQLFRFCWSRSNFLNSLKYFDDNFNINYSEHVAESIYNSIRLWTNLKNLFIKSAIIGNSHPINKYSDSIIRRIIEDETAVLKYLVDTKFQSNRRNLYGRESN